MSDWEKEFDGYFMPRGYEGVIGLDPIEVKAFIRKTLLSSQSAHDEEIIGKLQGLKVGGYDTKEGWISLAQELKSFISSTLAEARKERDDTAYAKGIIKGKEQAYREIKGIIEEEAKKLSKQVGAGKSWDIALIRVSDILSVLREKE